MYYNVIQRGISKKCPFTFYLNSGVMLMKNSKLILGIGLDSTDRYSSLNKLFITPFKDNSACFNETCRSNVRLLM